MSITSNEEALVRLADVPAIAWLPRRHGKSFTPTTVYRWAQIGINGVRLETVQVAGCKATSEAAIKRFFAALQAGAAPAPTDLEAQRAKRIADSERALKAAGV